MSMLRRKDDGRFLVLAQSMREQIREFAERVNPSNDGEPAPADPEAAHEPHLRVAIEELRAQNETLLEACMRLEREMAKYRDLYDSAPDAFVTTDARGIIVDANPAAAALLGLPPDMLPGKLLIAFIARRDTSPFRNQLRMIVDGPGHGTVSVQIRPRGGTPLLAHLTVRAVRGSVLSTAGGRDYRIAFHWTVRLDATARESLPPA